MKNDDTPDTSGHEKKGHAGFQIGILDENFNSRIISIPDPKVNGRQISEASGHRPAESFIVLQRLHDGGIEDISPDELVNIGRDGVEEFFVLPGDRTFRFTVDGRRFEWPYGSPVRETILRIAGHGDDVYLIQELEDQPDAVIEPGEKVSLSDQGVERFKTRPAKKIVTVYYGETAYEIPVGIYSGRQLSDEFGVTVGHILDLVTDDGFKEIKPDDKIRIKEGMKFISHPPCGGSS